MKLVVVVSDVDQVPKVENLGGDEGPAVMMSSPEKQTRSSGVVPPIVAMRLVAPAIVELESHLMLSPT